MSSTDELEKALEQQAQSLEPAQRNFVMAQFEHYKWNEEQIELLQRQYEEASEEVDAAADLPAKERKLLVEQRGTIFRQRHQLVAEQGTLFSHIMRWIKGTAAGKSELEAFLEE